MLDARRRPRAPPWAGARRRRRQRGVRRRRPAGRPAPPVPRRRGDPRHRCDGPRRRRAQEPAQGRQPRRRATATAPSCTPSASSTPPTLAAAATRSAARWLDGAPDRGFSMAHDDLVDELLPDALVVLARDADGASRGFLHFVPVFGRPAVSLGFMRRDRDTPNGLTDFLVVHAARLLAERGIDRVLAELRRLRTLAARSRQPARARARPAAARRRPLVPDRAPVPLQREVRAALAAALPAVRPARWRCRASRWPRCGPRASCPSPGRPSAARARPRRRSLRPAGPEPRSTAGAAALTGGGRVASALGGDPPRDRRVHAGTALVAREVPARRPRG